MRSPTGQQLREPRGSPSGTGRPAFQYLQVKVVRGASCSHRHRQIHTVSLKPGLYPVSAYVLVGPSRADPWNHAHTKNTNVAHQKKKSPAKQERDRRRYQKHRQFRREKDTPSLPEPDCDDDPLWRHLYELLELPLHGFDSGSECSDLDF